MFHMTVSTMYKLSSTNQSIYYVIMNSVYDNLILILRLSYVILIPR
jgi:hypothetical protein